MASGHNYVMWRDCAYFTTRIRQFCYEWLDWSLMFQAETTPHVASYDTTVPVRYIVFVQDASYACCTKMEKNVSYSNRNIPIIAVRLA